MQQPIEPFLRAVEEEYGEEITGRCREKLTRHLFAQEIATQKAVLEEVVSDTFQIELQEAVYWDGCPFTSYPE